MKEKKIERLFIASEVHLQKRVWVSAAYNAYGEMSYSFFISPKKTLVYSRTNEDGVTKFYLYDTDEEIGEPYYATCSYTDFDDSYGTTVSSGHEYGYGYLVPVEEYFGVTTDTHPFFVKALLNLDNLLKKVNKKNNFYLSTNKSEASGDLARIAGYKGRRITSDTVAKLPVWKKAKKPKRKIEKLFLVSRIYDDAYVVERWIQYETEGQIDHYIMVSNKKYLAYTSTDSEGKTHTYLYGTDEEITLDPEENFKSSVSTINTPHRIPFSIVETPGIMSKPVTRRAPWVLKKELKAYKASVRRCGYSYAYPMPVHKYTGIKVKSPFISSLCVYFSNVGKKGYMCLSMDEDIAKGQLAKFGYAFTEEEQEKRKKLSLR